MQSSAHAVVGIDSSTQGCKVVVRAATSGTLLRQGRAPHPAGTEVDPEHWWRALLAALAAAGGLDDVAAMSVAGQQHGMVALDGSGRVVRPALLWNDTRSAPQAQSLIDDLGGGETGRAAWAEAVGLVPVASFTVTKLRWLAEVEPTNAARTAGVALPHDWLTWRLAGGGDVTRLATDRGDASGTAYWSATTGSYRLDLLELALGHRAVVPRVLGPQEPAGQLAGSVLGTAHGASGAAGGGANAGSGLVLGPGTGDNAGAALGLDARPGDVVLSIGTSGVACAVAERPSADPSGTVAGFADATGRFLPLVATLNAARVLDATAAMLRVSHDELSTLALSAPPGADGLVLVPYLEGERTPNLPDATGALHGLQPQTMTAAHVARASVEGLLCGLADALDALRTQGHPIRRVLLVGGGARSEAVRVLAPAILGVPVTVPVEGEYVADGAARQAAWTLLGSPEPPAWPAPPASLHEADPQPAVRERYRQARELYLRRLGDTASR